MLVLADDEAGALWPGDPGFEELVAEHGAFRRKLEQEGILLGAGRLRPTSTAKTVRVRDGKVLRTDGPFAETKEQLGGFYLIECRDLEHALELAAELPTARKGSVEVRALVG
jgi:hypothetical protein